MAHSSTDTQIQQLRSQVSALEAENQRLRQSELRYRQVFENAPISMFLANREGYVTAMNAAAEELYGLKLEQLNEQACPIFDNPQLVENGTLPYMLRALAGEAIVEPPNSYDTSRGFESGQPAPGRGHYAPLRNTAGEVEGFVEICPDYNDFFALQAQLLEEKERAAQERARLLSTVAQVANFLLRAPNYTAVLPEVVRLLGKVTGSDRCAITQVVDVPAAHQYLTRLRHEWCRAEIPSVLDGSPEFDQGIIADTRSGFTSQLWQGEAVNFVVSELEQPEWIDFFTAHHNTSMLIVPVMIDRQCWGHIGFDNCGEPRLHDEAEIAILQVAAESIAAAIKRQAQDNALRESERRYRTLFELSNEGIFRFETEPPLPTALSIDEQLKWCYRHFRYAEINDTMADQYGLNGPEEMVGKGFADIYPETSALNLEANRRLIENGYQGRGAETEEIGADGQPKHFLSSVVSNIRDGYVYGGWGTQTDITELRQMQQALLEAEQAKSQKLEQLNAELRQTLAELEGRDRILNATATATNALLTVDSLDEAIDAALQLLGEALKTDRVVVIENSFPSDSAFAHWHILYQWNSPGTIAQIDHPDYAYGTYEGVESWYEWQRQGKVTSYLLDEMSDPFRSQQADLGVKALHVLPIFVAGEFWGTFGIDNCREAKRISAAELSVLRVAADCIGSAIQRDRSQQSLLTAKQAQIAEQARNEVLTQRDQLLNASATSVSALLTVENLDNAIDLALKTIGEVLDTDRASVVEFFYPDNSEASLPYWRLLYEWHTVSTPSQLGHPTAAEGTHDDFEDNYARLKQGDIFSDEIDDLPEPFRSQMAAVDVKAIHHVPIFIEDQLWGLLGFDDCCEVKRRSAAELSLLRVAADCIGSAIARQRSQSLLQQTEHARAVEQTRNVVLQQRDHILNATATATNALLTVDSLDEAIGAALQTIGEALETDRANVLENLMPAPDSAFPGWRHSGHEWASPGTVLQHSSSEAAQGSYEDIPWLYELFQRGQTASYQIEDTPEPFRSAQVAIGVKSTHLVPIFVEGQWWGVLGFDDCQTAKQRSAAELSILKVAADCIGSAIQRERSQQSLQQAEQARVAEEVRNELLTQRDRLLNASATSVSALLTVENLDEAINLALQTIGEAVETDRAIVVEFFYSDTDAPLPLWRLLYEWNTPITLSQLADPINSQGTHEGLEALLVSLAQGESLSITLDEMAEPFRSQQAALGVKVMHDVPIFVEGQLWGVLGFDDCREAKPRSSGELSLLRVAADCIGSAIARQRSQSLLQQTEQARAVEQARNEVLQQRDSMLTTVAEATKDLLDSSNSDLDQVFPAALQVLGEGLECDRVGVLENFGQFSTQVPDYQTVIYEWAAPGTVQQISHPDAAQVSNQGLDIYTEQYLQDNGFGGLVDDFPEPIRSALKAVDIQSSYSVPIWLGEEFWGIVGFDYCREATQFSASEVAVLRTAAACIGGAIQRDRAQKAALQAEQARAQELEQLNTELQQTLERLAESEKHYRTLFELSNEGIYRLEVNPPISTNLSVDEQVEWVYQHARYVEVNNEMARQYGLSSLEDLLGKSLADFYPEASDVNLETNRRIIENGYAYQSETEEIGADGEPKRFLVSFVGDVQDGYLYGGWGIQTDITELRQAQQALLEAEQDRVAKLVQTNQALKNSLDRLAAEPNLDAFLGHVLTEISQQLNIHTSWLQFYDPTTETLRLCQWIDQGTIRSPQDFPELGPLAQPIAVSDAAIWDLLLQTRRPFVITAENAAQYVFPGTEDWQLQWAERHGIQAGVNILLILGDTPLGILGLLSAERSEFTPEELEHAQAIAQQATLAIQLTHLAEEAKQAALIGDRSRVAREIHDTLAQSFGGILMQLQAADYFYTRQPHTARSHFDNAQKLATAGLSEARRTVWLLHQSELADQDFPKLLTKMVEQMTAHTSLRVSLAVTGTPIPLAPSISAHLIRIVQESIYNILRHAQATTSHVRLAYEPEHAPEQIRLSIRDDGCGFDLQQPRQGFGLTGLQQRAQDLQAELQINSRLGQGTDISLTVPLESVRTAKVR